MDVESGAVVAPNDSDTVKNSDDKRHASSLNTQQHWKDETYVTGPQTIKIKKTVLVANYYSSISTITLNVMIQ